MDPTDSLPSAISARLNEPGVWLEALPRVLPLPNGRLYACFVLFRAIKRLRAIVRLLESIVHAGSFASRSLLQRQEWAALVSHHVGENRQHFAELTVLLPHPGWLHRALLARLDGILDEYSDLAEDMALGADPEMETLAKELNDVL